MVQDLTFCGQYLIDIQDHVSYTPSHKKEDLINKQEEAAKDTPDTIGVKEAKDKDGNMVIIYTTGGNAADDEEKKDVERAWEMIRNMTD